MKGNLISLISVIFILLLGMILAGCANQLMDAAAKGDFKKTEKLLAAGADVKALSGYRYLTPLHYAAWHGHANTAALLIQKGANVNAIDTFRWTPLHWAVYYGQADVVSVLLKNGADPEMMTDNDNREKQPKTALMLAREKGQTVIVRMLREAEEKQNKNLYAKEEKPTASQNLTKEDMEKIVQAAVEKAAKPKEKESRSVSTGQSDIDKPSFAMAERIFGDNDIAVVIGIEGYQSLPKSDFSYDDAKLVKEYIKALGFKERNIELITDEKATKSSIEKSLEAWLKNKAKADSKVFVYYSGHGAPDPSTGEAYLVPYDGDPNYLSVTGYPLKRLYDNLGKLQVAEVTVVLDACFSGAGGRSVLAQGARPLVMMADIKSIPSNMAILSATQGSQISTSSPEKGHGIFTYYFLKAIKDGKKDVAEIYSYIKPLVEDDAKQINVQQSPSVSPDPEKIKGKFAIRK